MLEKARKQILPRSLQKEYNPANTLISAQWDPFQTSDLQNCKRIYLGSFRQFQTEFVVVCYSSSKTVTHKGNALLLLSLLRSSSPKLATATAQPVLDAEPRAPGNYTITKCLSIDLNSYSDYGRHSLRSSKFESSAHCPSLEPMHCIFLIHCGTSSPWSRHQYILGKWKNK